MHPRCIQCWSALFFLIFLAHIVCWWHGSDVGPEASPSTFLLSGPFVWVLLSYISRMVLTILQGKLPWSLFLLWNFCHWAWFWEAFFFVWRTLFLFSFHPRLPNGIHFQYSRVLEIFLFSKRSDSFLIWQFYSFCYLSFSAFYFKQSTFLW